MDLIDGMRVLVATVETGSFSGAARRLGISPKLASKYMGELEQRLGAPLVARTTRRMGLTPAGEQLMARLPDWLDQLDEMTLDLAEPKRGLSGTLRISAPQTWGEMIALPRLRDFAAPHPALHIDLRLTDRFVDLAAEGIDLALRIGRLDDSALIARRIGSTAFVLVAAPAYLDRAGMPQSLDELSTHECIRDSNLADPGVWTLDEEGTPRRVAINGRFTVSSLGAARDLAIAGEGIAFCPDYLVAGPLSDGRLRQLHGPFAGTERPIHALHLPGRQMPRRTRALIDHMATTA